MNLTDNLYIPGVKTDGTPRMLIALDSYWKQHSTNQSRGEPGDAYLPELQGAFVDRNGISALILIDQLINGKVDSRLIMHNIVTDNGAKMLLNAYASAGVPTTSVGQYFVLNTQGAASQLNQTLTGSTPNATGAALTVLAGGNPTATTGNKASAYVANQTSATCTSGSAGTLDPSTGGAVQVGFGLATVDYMSGNAATTGQTATNIPLAATYTPHSNHSVGEWVVAAPQTGDAQTTTNMTSSAIIYNSAASTNGATGTSLAATVTGTGIGTRQAAFGVALFPTASTGGTYTELWVITTSTLAALSTATNTYNHLSFPPQILSSIASLQITYIIKV